MAAVLVGRPWMWRFERSAACFFNIFYNFVEKKSQIIMGDMLNEKKIRLASLILALEDEALINTLEKILSTYQVDKTVDLDFFNRPVRENISAEDLAHEQHNTPVDKDKMDALVAALNIQEPVEDLLEQLTP